MRAGRFASPADPSAGVPVLLGDLEPSDALASTLALLQWLRSTGERDARVLSVHGGTALPEVRGAAPTRVVYDPRGWTVPRIAQRLHLPRLARLLRSMELRRLMRLRGPVYVADAAAAPLLHRLDPQAGPVVGHHHASADPLDRLAEVDRAVLVSRCDRWISGSPAKTEELVSAGVDVEAIDELPDLLALPEVGSLDENFIATCRGGIAQRCGIPIDAGLVVGVGTIDWWTVPDAFVRVAWEVVRRVEGREVHFLWVAHGASERMLWPLRHDIRHAGLEGRVHVKTGEGHPWQAVAASDVYVSTRLGETTPQGHRDAIVLGRPIVAFADPEQPDALAPHEGRTVPHLDVDAMAEQILDLLAASAPSEDRGRPLSVLPAWFPSVGGPAILERLR